MVCINSLIVMWLAKDVMLNNPLKTEAKLSKKRITSNRFVAKILSVLDF